MTICLLKSKIHRASVTGASLDYEGSLTIAADLAEQVGLLPYEKILVGNMGNGERFETYVIKGIKNSGDITLNGPAARKVHKGDIIIIISYALMDFEEAKNFKPWLVFPNETNNSLT